MNDSLRMVFIACTFVNSLLGASFDERRPGLHK